MSWMKRPQEGTAPRVEPPGFASAATQPYGNQQNMFPNYQGVPTQQQQPMWQMSQQPQQQQYNQQYGQVYQSQQPIANNTNQYFQQPQQYNENYTNQNYDSTQQGFQQNYYQNQAPHLPNYTKSEGNTDGWEDNWNWGWEDTSRQQPKPVSQVVSNQPPAHPQNYNNANILEESFSSTNTWNWAMEDKKQQEVQSNNDIQNTIDQKIQRTHLDIVNNGLSTNSDISNQRRESNGSAHEAAEEVKSLNDKELTKDHLPNLALGKRFNLENLTPQWSIESQMSQDSSDPQTHSEGTYRSENQSRNSSKGSPGPHTDTSNINYTHSGLNETSLTNSEWSKHSTDDSVALSVKYSNRRESFDELASSVQEMAIAAKQHLLQESDDPSQNIVKVVEHFPDSNQFPVHQSSMPPPPPVSSTHIPQLCVPPGPPASLPPLSASVSSPSSTSSAPQHVLPPPSSLPGPPPSLPGPPPASFPTSSGQNPFKSSNPFSHKNIAKVASANPQLFPSQAPGSGLTSPTAVIKVVQQERPVTSYGANLETTPDNSERPDQPQHSNYRQVPINPQIPDNLEVAPQNDRNEYLQTAHLSIADYGENTDFSGNIAPPGLRRMGVGQQELEYNQNLNISGDEPPPGLARMVPGQQTESDNSYNQRDDDYMDRQIDGQPTDMSGRPYRQAEGQQTSDSFSQLPASRSAERMPVGLDRMVPGEPSTDDFPQYPAAAFGGPNEHRVVTGVDRVREQNVDGSDYTERAGRNEQRNVIGSRMQEVNTTGAPDYGLSVDDQQREITMEGENLQDLSLISSTEMSFSRDQTYDSINVGASDAAKERNHDIDDIAEYATKNSRQSLNRATSGEESERERSYKTSPRRDRDKPKSSRDRDRDREKDRGRYSRSDRKYDREPEKRSARGERRGDKDRRERDRDRGREDSPDERRHRRSVRSRRYETEDTDCYSDKERDGRRYREGSYTSSRPPRGEERPRRRPPASDRDGRYDDDGHRRRRDRDDRGRDERDDRGRDERDARDPARFERRYRPIDPRKVDAPRRGPGGADRDAGNKETYSSGSRPGSREATDEEPTRRRADRRRPRHDRYYDGYGAEQYQYYERLRRTDPAAYLQIYNSLVDRYAHSYYDGYGAGYSGERGSVHSGRSSEAGLKHADTEPTTDMSLSLQPDEALARSDRMTPLKFTTAHVKCSLGAGAVAVSRSREPRVQLLSLAALGRHPLRDDLDGYPGPLVRGVTHKKSVVEYCVRRAAEAAAGAGDEAAGGDRIGASLLWELLALMLRQNGVVVGADVADLLMSNVKTVEASSGTTGEWGGARRARSSSAPSPSAEGGSSLCEDDEGGEQTAEATAAPLSEEQKRPAVDEKEAIDKFREYLIYGNRQEALEWAVRCGLWAHALQLSSAGERRERAAVSARFVASLGAADPLHSLYAALAGRAPPALTGASAGRRGDWRPHAAILLANPSPRPDHDRRHLVRLGDALDGRGLIFSAQFCYLSAGVPLAPHPLAPLTAPAASGPPRLSLLLADPRAPSLRRFATSRAIFATEIYEYALSLSGERAPDELVPYKLVMAARLVDAGEPERALRYAERAARALTAGEPRDDTRPLARAVAALADRLQCFDPALRDESEAGGEEAGGAGGEEPSPRHRQWLTDVSALAARLPEGAARRPSVDPTRASETGGPQRAAEAAHHHCDPPEYERDHAGSWTEQTLPRAASELMPFPTEETPDYAEQFYMQSEEEERLRQLQHCEPAGPYPPYEGQAPAPGGTYWQHDAPYGYLDGEGPPPTITMPGAARTPSAERDRDSSAQMTDRDTHGLAPAAGDDGSPEGASGADRKPGGGGWLSGVLSKLALRPPNQMILPDDKNPTIVWDEDNKCWRDTASPDDARPAGPPAPPPARPPPAANALRMQRARRRSPSRAEPSRGRPGPPVAELYFDHFRHKEVVRGRAEPGRRCPRPAGGAPSPAGPGDALVLHTYAVAASGRHLRPDKDRRRRLPQRDLTAPGPLHGTAGDPRGSVALPHSAPFAEVPVVFDESSQVDQFLVS